MDEQAGAGDGVIELDALVGAVTAAWAWADRRLQARQVQLLSALPGAAGGPLRVVLPGGGVVEEPAPSLIAPRVHELAALELELPCRPGELEHRGVRRLGLFLVTPGERPVAGHALRIVVAKGPPPHVECYVDNRRIREGPIAGLPAAGASHRPTGRGPIRCVVIGEPDVAPVAGALSWSSPAG